MLLKLVQLILTNLIQNSLLTVMWKYRYNDLPTKDVLSFNNFDMTVEKDRDKEIAEIKDQLLHGKENKKVQNKFILIDNIVYYISSPDNEATLRLYIPKHLKEAVVKEFHDNFHMRIDKTYDLIRQKYYWPKLFKELNNYVSTCVTCQKRNLKKIKPPLQEIDIPVYLFAKIGLDLSGPYPTSLSGNTYIVSFIDLYSGWPEAFAVPDKSADQICNLLIDEIFPRHGQVLELCSDNGTENINYKVKETLEALNIHHV